MHVARSFWHARSMENFPPPGLFVFVRPLHAFWVATGRKIPGPPSTDQAPSRAATPLLPQHWLHRPFRAVPSRPSSAFSYCLDAGRHPPSQQPPLSFGPSGQPESSGPWARTGSLETISPTLVAHTHTKLSSAPSHPLALFIPTPAHPPKGQPKCPFNACLSTDLRQRGQRQTVDAPSP